MTKNLDKCDYHGRPLGQCRECGEDLMSTGRYTVYCPSCDVCPDCGCPNADGFAHYAGCPAIEQTEDKDAFEEEEA